MVFEPELPDVLHHVSFDIKPGEKVNNSLRRRASKLTNYS
jgi:hypothetical protein